MDIVTHGITGVLVARALPSGDKGSVMAAGLIGALAPDLDAIARLWDPMAAITVHRTATHSFLGGGIIALGVAGLVWALVRENFRRLLLAAYLGVVSHIVSDLLTSFGTAFLWPISDRRFALAQHYLVDPIFSALAFGFLIASFRFREKRITWVKLGLTGMMLYVFVAAGSHEMAASRWRGFIESQGIRPIRFAVVPLFPGPLRWLGVAETEDAFYQQIFWLHGTTLEALRLFPKNHDGFSQLDDLREVKSFLKFARFPWRQIWNDGPYSVVEYRELAFADHPLGIMGGPLSLRIWIDKANSVKKVEFGHRF